MHQEKKLDLKILEEIFEAMSLIAETGKGPEDQTSSMGCSIKWKINLKLLLN